MPEYRWPRWFAVLAGSVLVAGLGIRRWQTRWGATRDEAARALPGDEIVPVPQYAATNAVDVDAAPGTVWPWLVQMGGYDRAGWYSFDRLDNGGIPSAREIVPELQALRVGDVMATSRSGDGFLVEAITPGHSLVLSIRAADAVTSSVLALEPTTDGRTRLVNRVRLRAELTPQGLAYRALMELGHVVMARQMLLGIKLRVERVAARDAGRPAAPRP